MFSAFWLRFSFQPSAIRSMVMTPLTADSLGVVEGTLKTIEILKKETEETTDKWMGVHD